MIRLLILLLIPSICFAQKLPYNDASDLCFERLKAGELNIIDVAPQFKIRRGLRQCQLKKFSKATDWRECLVERTRRSRKVLQVVLDKRIPDGLSHTSFGNLGWDNENTAAIGSVDRFLENALKIAKGVDTFNIGSKEEAGDIEFHNEIVAEIKCIRRKGRCRTCETSFNEIQLIPPVE